MRIEKIILGPPGTGKTTKLIETLQQFLQDGIEPEKIGYVSFTRKAVSHARDLVKEKFGLADNKLPWFRTLHSLSFHFHHLEASTVMGWADYTAICKMLGLTISSVKISEEGFANYQHTEGDRLFFLENLARTTGKTVDQTWREHPNEDLDFRRLQLLADTIVEYKKASGKMDFTDMINYFVKHKVGPKLEVLIVDEAQDLSPMQWQMVDILKKDVSSYIMAGDDDQAIYGWAGADVSIFQAQSGETEVLTQSYRVPSRIHALATSIVTKIRKRSVKDYKPTSEIGFVEHVNSLDWIQAGPSTGTWLMLARNIYLIQELDRYCIDRGLLFESKYGSAVDHQVGVAIKYWELLRAGQAVSAAMAKLVYQYLGTKEKVVWGSKKELERLPDDEQVTLDLLTAKYGLLTIEDWRAAFTRATPKDKQYYVLALKVGENLLKEPRIRINTIHGVKGGEADNVLILTDMSKRTWDEYQLHPDEETRVWYVGVTRAKKRLYILQPSTQYFFTL